MAAELYKAGDLSRIPSCSVAGRPFAGTPRTGRFAAQDNRTASPTGSGLLDQSDAFGAADQSRQTTMNTVTSADVAHATHVASVLR